MRMTFKTQDASEVQVKSWGSLLLSIRRQARSVSDYLALPELALLLQCMLLGTIALFAITMNGFGDTVVQTRLACALVATWLLVKLYFKAYMADRVVAAVSYEGRRDVYTSLRMRASNNFVHCCHRKVQL